jgi:hypothetical protein
MLDLTVLGARVWTPIAGVAMFAAGKPGDDAAGEQQPIDRALVTQQAMRAARHLGARAVGVAGAVTSNCE